MKRVIATVIAGVALATASGAHAAGYHLCHQGDPPILASAQTSCGLAVNYVDLWFNCRQGVWLNHTLMAYSLVTHRRYPIAARERNGRMSRSPWNLVAASIVDSFR